MQNLRVCMDDLCSKYYTLHDTCAQTHTYKVLLSCQAIKWISVFVSLCRVLANPVTFDMVANIKFESTKSSLMVIILMKC